MIAKASHARAIALQADGRIVLAGDSIVGSITEFAAARYTSSGVLDNSFGSGGAVSTQIGASNKSTGIPVNDEAAGLAIDPQGRIVLAGYTTDTSTRAHPLHSAMVRYTTSGILDTSFGGTGKVVTPLGPSPTDTGRAVVIQPDGKIILAGNAYAYPGSNSYNYDFALARFTSAGALDGTFGTNGKVLTSFTSSSDYAIAVALQPDGGIVAGGSANGNLALARYLGDSPLTATALATGRTAVAGLTEAQVSPAFGEVVAGWAASGSPIWPDLTSDGPPGTRSRWTGTRQVGDGLWTRPGHAGRSEPLSSSRGQ